VAQNVDAVMSFKLWSKVKKWFTGVLLEFKILEFVSWWVRLCICP
jgi:hypothetical protein